MRKPVRFIKPYGVQKGTARWHEALVDGVLVSGTYAEVSKLYDAGKKADQQRRNAAAAAARKVGAP